MGNDLLTMCAYCKNVKDSDTGEFISNDNPRYGLLVEMYKDSISHGACPPCGKKVKEEVRQYKESKLAKKI